MGSLPPIHGATSSSRRCAFFSTEDTSADEAVLPDGEACGRTPPARIGRLQGAQEDRRSESESRKWLVNEE